MKHQPFSTKRNFDSFKTNFLQKKMSEARTQKAFHIIHYNLMIHLKNFDCNSNFISIINSSNKTTHTSLCLKSHFITFPSSFTCLLKLWHENLSKMSNKSRKRKNSKKCLHIQIWFFLYEKIFRVKICFFKGFSFQLIRWVKMEIGFWIFYLRRWRNGGYKMLRGEHNLLNFGAEDI